MSEHIDNTLDGLLRPARIERPSDDVVGLDLVRRKKQILTSCAGLGQIDRRENAALGKISVKDELHIARTLKFLEHYIIHAASRLNESRREYRQAAALTHAPCGAEELLRHMKGRGIETARKCTSARCHGKVVCAGKTRDTVKQHHNILLMLYETLCALDDHLGNTLMILGKLIEGGVDDLHVRSFNGFLDIGYFLGTLIDQKDDQMDLGIVQLNGLGHFL